MTFEEQAGSGELRFHEAEEKYQDLFDNTSDAVITTDLEDNITSWNRKAENLFGWKAGDVTGKKLSPLLVLPDRQAEREYLINDAVSGKTVSGINTVLQHSNRVTKINVKLTLFPIKNTNLDIIGLFNIISDNTEFKKNEELRLENLRLKNMASISKKLSLMKGFKKAEEVSLENKRFKLENKAEFEFITEMNHKLRNPMNSIIGFSELLKQKIPGNLSEKQEQYIDNILKSGKYVLDIIDNFDLRMVKAGKIQLVIEKVSVPEIINETIALLEEDIEKKKIVLKKDLDVQLDIIEADRKRFKQIFFNLLDNALNSDEIEGGIVTVTTKKDSNMAKISVSDTSIGIMDDEMVFMSSEGPDPEALRKYEGSRLAISRRLVELHGGRTMADARSGEGRTFTFLLPIIAKKEE